MDAITNDNSDAMESMNMGMEIITSNNNNCVMDSMGMGMGVINDGDDNFSNDNNYFPTATTPMTGVVYNELLFLHYNYLCHHNFNDPPQSRPNIYNYLFHHSSHIHWL